MEPWVACSKTSLVGPTWLVSWTGASQRPWQRMKDSGRSSLNPGQPPGGVQTCRSALQARGDGMLPMANFPPRSRLLQVAFSVCFADPLFPCLMISLLQTGLGETRGCYENLPVLTLLIGCLDKGRTGCPKPRTTPTKWSNYNLTSS